MTSHSASTDGSHPSPSSDSGLTANRLFVASGGTKATVSLASFFFLWFGGVDDDDDDDDDVLVVVDDERGSAPGVTAHLRAASACDSGSKGSSGVSTGNVLLLLGSAGSSFAGVEGDDEIDVAVDVDVGKVKEEEEEEGGCCFFVVS